MFPDLSKSSETLCSMTKSLLQDDLFLSKVDIASSTIEKGKLYWNIGTKQGFVVIDPNAKKVYRVFDVKEKLSENQICDPALAQLVLEDLFYFLDLIKTERLAESMLTLYISSHPSRVNGSIN